ncbi:metal-dependent hydrolase, partial [Clostridium perfringens]
SYPLSTIFKHRGFLHSITPVILIFTLGIFLRSLFIKSIALGYLLHLVGDIFSESGIKWFLPFYNKDIKMPLGILRYRTGGLKEYVILGISIVILMLEIQKFHLINLFSI